MQINIYTTHFPAKRAFRWKAFGILSVLYILGNLAVIPLLKETDVPIEPAWFLAIVSAISVALIGFGLLLGSKTGLGAPLIEGHLHGKDAADWARSVFAIAMLTAILGSIVILWLQRPSASTGQYPTGWKLVLASIKAGTVEEMYTRLLLVSLFAWLGVKIRRDTDGRPTQTVYWGAIILSGLWFGWEHVEGRLSNPGIDAAILVELMVVNTIFGIVFGWQFWKLGLECAVLSHFMVDGVASAVVVPAYLSHDPLVWTGLGIGLVFLTGISLRLLTSAQTKR